MIKLANTPFITQFDPMSYDDKQMHPLGTLAISNDGRKFRYALAGGTALVNATLQQGSAVVAHHANMAVAAAAAVGATSVTVTLGATAATANQYAEGYLSINDANGEGYLYKIASNPAADASASLVVSLEDPIAVALTTSSKATLVANPWKGVIQAPTTLTAGIAGIAPFDVPAAKYCWLQTGGICVALQDGTPAAGGTVGPSNAVAGALEVGVLAQGIVGNSLQTGVDTQHQTVILTLD